MLSTLGISQHLLPRLEFPVTKLTSSWTRDAVLWEPKGLRLRTSDDDNTIGKFSENEFRGEAVNTEMLHMVFLGLVRDISAQIAGAKQVGIAPAWGIGWIWLGHHGAPWWSLSPRHGLPRQ